MATSTRPGPSNYAPAGVAPHKLGLNPLELEFRAENALIEVKPLIHIPKVKCIEVPAFPYDLSPETRSLAVILLMIYNL